PSLRLGGDIPARLEHIVMACLAKDPAARPQTAEILASLLAEVPLERPWTQDRAREWWAANRSGDGAAPSDIAPAESRVAVKA
ncbi:MAG TPA: hypothetical protein VEB59_06485, partial [Gemmatimonadales bacterium]|nr:hypothetical protein [Gemmatimonadales bacterium]